MSRPLPILAVQAAAVPGDPDATLRKFERDLRRLHGAYPDVRLFVWGELYLSAEGSMTDIPDVEGKAERIAQPIPGPLTDRLCELARRFGVWLVPGSFYERADDGRIHNTLVAISPAGDIVARYRKLFLWRPWEHSSPGSEFVTFDIDGVGRIGLAICYDIWFPEVARNLAWLGAEVLIIPTATPTSDRDQEVVMARAHAIANQVWVVNVNLGGRPGPGRSVIVDPEGHVLQQAGDGEEYLSETLDLDAVTRVRKFGSVGLNRMWDVLDEEGGLFELPMYGGRIRPRPATIHPSGDEPTVERSTVATRG